MDKSGCFSAIFFIAGLYLFTFLLSIPERNWSTNMREDISQTKANVNIETIILDSNSKSGLIHWISQPWTIWNPTTNSYLIQQGEVEKTINPYNISNVDYLFTCRFINMEVKYFLFSWTETNISERIFIRIECHEGVGPMVSIAFEEEIRDETKPEVMFQNDILIELNESRQKYEEVKNWVVHKIIEHNKTK